MTFYFLCLFLGPGIGLVSFTRLLLYPLLFHAVPYCLVSYLFFFTCRAVNVTYQGRCFILLDSTNQACSYQ